MKVYDACPYCLTEVIVEKNVDIIEKKQMEGVNKFGDGKVSTPSLKGVSQSRTEQGCVHYFGYLSKRSTKETIPEECMICENIVRCMLNNVTE